MRCLIIGPYYNGVANVIKVHKHYLELRGIKVDWYGFNDVSFDMTDILNNTEKLISSVKFSNYDIIDFHIGMYEAEQLLLKYLNPHTLPPRIFSVHSTSFELFKKINMPHLQEAVNNSIGDFFNGFIFYGTFARKLFESKYSKRPSQTIFIPATHSDLNITEKDNIKFEKKYGLKIGEYIGIIGYPSKWKNWQLMIDSFPKINKKTRFVFAGPWWDKKLGFAKKIIGNVDISVISEYVDGKDYPIFVKNSKFGVFPYINYPTFQGSGTVANYISCGKPCIVSSVTSLPEYVGNGGIVVNSEKPTEWAKAMNSLLGNEFLLSRLSKNMDSRKKLVDPKTYIDKVVKFYKKFIHR